MNYRDWLQQVIYKIINPVVRGMIKIGITLNFITTTGLISILGLPDIYLCRVSDRFGRGSFFGGMDRRTDTLRRVV